ncbi:hypothetical protein [Streptomyces sp. MBT62]|uniref:hypothetical protein n=1 Tax=Streptomyces sp. MBT62 TaxID=2800410 RepID=UPI001909E899|nr:hypothetical protein [Streptomyces sp. MBT62]MBK3568965.1 hypothetical protein [Streptomyces sp. MBT62]
MTDNESLAPQAQTAEEGVVMKLLTLTLEREGQPSETWRLDSAQARKEVKETPFTLTEASHYRLKVGFQIRHGIVSGVKYVNAVSRKGIRVTKNQLMLGSFGPQNEAHEVIFPRHGWEETPSGILSRGTYTAKSSFVDDDGKVQADFEYAFTIAAAG